jgi:hypothetical protein
MALWILRGVFLLSAAGVAFAILNSPSLQQAQIKYPWLLYVCMMFLALGIIAVDILTPRKRIEIVSCLYFGIVIGLFMTYLLGFTLEPLIFNTNF